MHEQIKTMYILLADRNPGPFTVELGHVDAGRCDKAVLHSAGFIAESRACELGEHVM